MSIILAAMALVAQDTGQPLSLDFSDPEVRAMVDKAKQLPKMRVENYIFATSSDGSTHSIQLKAAYSVEHRGSIWTTKDFSNVKGRKPTDAIRAKLFWSVDCDARTTALASFVEYGRNGEVISSATIPSYQQKAEPAVPSSVGEASLVAVCANFDQ